MKYMILQKDDLVICIAYMNDMVLSQFDFEDSEYGSYVKVKIDVKDIEKLYEHYSVMVQNVIDTIALLKKIKNDERIGLQGEFIKLLDDKFSQKSTRRSTTI